MAVQLKEQENENRSYMLLLDINHIVLKQVF